MKTIMRTRYWISIHKKMFIWLLNFTTPLIIRFFIRTRTLCKINCIYSKKEKKKLFQFKIFEIFDVLYADLPRAYNFQPNKCLCIRFMHGWLPLILLRMIKENCARTKRSTSPLKIELLNSRPSEQMFLLLLKFQYFHSS